MNLVERANLEQEAGRDPKLKAALLRICEDDPLFWFNTFAWTFDPREEHPDMPFNLYPFQEWAISKWYSHIERGEDFLIEKSRDMGITWMALLLFLYCWLFRPGWNFLVGSRKEDYVDTKGDMSTHFPKLRYALRMLPPWMQPKGFNPAVQSTYMKLEHPTSRNTITGESSNDSFGRGGRYKAILFDELAFWPFADAAWASASQSSPCRIAVSTPYGKANKFARLALAHGNQRLEP